VAFCIKVFFTLADDNVEIQKYQCGDFCQKAHIEKRIIELYILRTHQAADITAIVLKNKQLSTHEPN
jgi:hypothetical protein